MMTNRRSFFAAIAGLFAAKPLLSLVPKTQVLETPFVPVSREFLTYASRTIWTEFGMVKCVNGVIVEFDPTETLASVLESTARTGSTWA
jgi:hypothetical protein